MRYFVCELVLTTVILAVSVYLMSPRRCVERFSTVVYIFLFYLCAVFSQMVGPESELLAGFWYGALLVGGVLMCYFSFSRRSRYVLKGLDRRKGEELHGLVVLMRKFIQEKGLEGHVGFNFAHLVFWDVEEAREKELVSLVNGYLYQNRCLDYRRWRRIVVLVLGVQIICLAVQLGMVVVSMIG